MNDALKLIYHGFVVVFSLMKPGGVKVVVVST